MFFYLFIAKLQFGLLCFPTKFFYEEPKNVTLGNPRPAPICALRAKMLLFLYLSQFLLDLKKLIESLSEF